MEFLVFVFVSHCCSWIDVRYLEVRVCLKDAMMSHVRRTWSLGRNRSGVSCRTGSASIATCSGDAALVLLSRSNDVFQNLALEDWIEANVDLQRRAVLLLWRNRPAVVIGRHQNPWAECHLPAMRGGGVPLARRRSGGGTVFHDLGNLNLTFFSSKTSYDRRRNLKVVTEALRQLRPALDVRATDRFDILLNGHFKISGGTTGRELYFPESTAVEACQQTRYHYCYRKCRPTEQEVIVPPLHPAALRRPLRPRQRAPPLLSRYPKQRHAQCAVARRQPVGPRPHAAVGGAAGRPGAPVQRRYIAGGVKYCLFSHVVQINRDKQEIEMQHIKNTLLFIANKIC